MHISALLVNVIGFVATLFSIFMWIPQARITWRNRHNPIRLAGVSETTQWLSMIGYLLWGGYGVIIESPWVAAPSVVSFPLAIATIVIVRRGRRLVPEAGEIIMPEPVSVSDWTGSIPTFLIDSTVLDVPPISEPAGSDLGTASTASTTTGGYTPTTPIAIVA